MKDRAQLEFYGRKLQPGTIEARSAAAALNNSVSCYNTPINCYKMLCFLLLATKIFFKLMLFTVSACHLIFSTCQVIQWIQDCEKRAHQSNVSVGLCKKPIH